ncbi:MAG: sugar phosphate isomerase/epimerase family protein [Planctomycetota bacterium]|jgi:sugar phosphate isomerase/epimerase
MSSPTNGASRIAVCSWSLQATTPQELIEMLHRLEIDSVQLALNPVVEDPAVWGRAAELLRGAGVRIASGMLAMAGEDYSTLETIARTGGVRPDQSWPHNLARSTRIAQCADEHDIRLVTFHAGFLPHDAGPERTKMLDRLHLVADAFEQRDVHLGLETGQESADTLLGLLEELRRPGIGVNFDPANMILYAMGDPVDALRRLAPHVRQIHVKDALPTDEPGTWGTEVPVGEGAVDWPAFFGVARRIEPPVDYVIEREAGDDRLDDVATARDVLRRLTDAASART